MSIAEKPDRPEQDTILQRRFHLAGIFILVAGIFSAILVYITAAPDHGRGALGYEVVNGISYPIMPNDSKRYEYDLERIGGKSNVLAVEFTEWFKSLWHGRRLADTLAFISVGGSLACFFLAYVEIEPPAPDDRTRGNKT